MSTKNLCRRELTNKKVYNQFINNILEINVYIWIFFIDSGHLFSSDSKTSFYIFIYDVEKIHFQNFVSKFKK